MNTLQISLLGNCDLYSGVCLPGLADGGAANYMDEIKGRENECRWRRRDDKVIGAEYGARVRRRKISEKTQELGKLIPGAAFKYIKFLQAQVGVLKLMASIPVDQSPKQSMLDALKPSMKALIQDGLSRHSDVDVKVAVASCISEITRITTPNAPYTNDQMR
ncbi:Myc-type, basic helix-loop-helix (bHLH) domain-containing protein, partial [Cynara cardunculus var. scolymus]